MTRLNWMALVCALGIAAVSPSNVDAQQEKAPKPDSVSLGEYVQTYMTRRPSLKTAELAVEGSELEVEQATAARRTDLDVDAEAGPHLYHYTSSHPLDPVGVVSGTGAINHRAANGNDASLRAHAQVTTQPHPIGGTIQYGALGSYHVPLLRNRGGSLFEMEADAARARTEALEASLRAEELFACQDAISRYINRYAAQEQLAVYRDLLQDKRRIFLQTDRDYRRKMVSRLDYLAARSDWLEAKSREELFVADLERADAALRAFAPLEGPIALESPGWQSAAAPSGKDLLERLRKSHPEIQRLEARKRALEREKALIHENLETRLDLGGIAGADRYHDRVDPNLDPADATDLYGLVSLRMSWPIKRPQDRYRLQLLTLQQRQLESRYEQLLVDLESDVEQARATIARRQAELEVIEEQIEVAQRQIAEARREYRAGKLEFQDFLVHWQLYQRARLARWDAMLAVWRARARMIPLLDEMPEVCQ